MRAKTAVSTALSVAVLLLAGCVGDTLNVSGPVSTPGGPCPEAMLEAEEGWIAGQSATLTVNWAGGTRPYTISADMGGGTTTDVPTGTPAVTPFTHDFTLVEGSWSYAVTVADANGIPGTTTGTYEVEPAPSAVSIDSVDVTGSTLTVDVSSSADDDTITVTVTEPPGLTVDATSKVATQTSGTAVFHWAPISIVDGGSGETTITATNHGGETDTATTMIVIELGPTPEGMLVAVPTSASTTIGEPVTVVVISGPLPGGAPFRHMNGVAVSFDRQPSDFTDFNIGAPGRSMWTPDGIWEAVQATGFTSGWEWAPHIREMGGGSWQLDFGAFSREGVETCSGGALFSFDVIFDTPGEVHVGLAAPIIWGHEYPAPTYSDDEEAINEHVWLDYSNEYFPNTITVTE